MEILKLPDDAKDFFNTHKYLLPHAARANNLEMVKLLLNFKADPNIEIANRYSFPIEAAAERGNLEMIKLLLANEENKIDLSQHTNIFWYVREDENLFDIFQYLLEHDAVLNPEHYLWTHMKRGASPLALLALNWDKDPVKAKIVLEMMINRGAHFFDLEKIHEGTFPQECYELLKKHNLLTY